MKLLIFGCIVALGAVVTSCHHGVGAGPDPGTTLASSGSGDGGMAGDGGAAQDGGAVQDGGAAQDGGVAEDGGKVEEEDGGKVEEDGGTGKETGQNDNNNNNDPITIATTSEALADNQIATLLSDILTSLNTEANLAVQNGSTDLQAFAQDTIAEIATMNTSLLAVMTQFDFVIQDSQLSQTLQSFFEDEIAQLQAETVAFSALFVQIQTNALQNVINLIDNQLAIEVQEKALGTFLEELRQALAALLERLLGLQTGTTSGEEQKGNQDF
jgi:hypothetical protein